MRFERQGDKGKMMSEEQAEYGRSRTLELGALTLII